jgi:putative tricarboxylic transport membrane protein
MEPDTDHRPDAVVESDDGPPKDGAPPEQDPPPEDDTDAKPDQTKLTRWVHVALGIVVAAVGAWLLYRSRTELAFRGSNNEPGPGYLPVLLTIGLVGLGLLLAAVWLFGPRARSGEAPSLSLHPREMGRAMMVWGALLVCALLIEPVGFLAAGEVLCVLVIVVIERIRSIPLIITLLLLPPAFYVLFDVLLEVQLPEGTLWY